MKRWPLAGNVTTVDDEERSMMIEAASSTRYSVDFA
jgi:hypothetical protein